MTFGGVLIARRKELGISQKTLAREIGISASALCKIERGTLRPSDSLLNKIKEFLGLDDNTLIDIDVDFGEDLMLEMLENRVTDTISELTDILYLIKTLKKAKKEE